MGRYKLVNYNSNDPHEKAREYSKMLWSMFDIYPIIDRVLREYNGKVYNKRFDEAARKAAEAAGFRVYVSRNQYNRNRVHITYCSGFYNWDQTILYIDLTTLPDGKRLDYKTLSNDLKQNMIGHYKTYQAITNSLQTIDEDIVKMRELLDARNAIAGKYCFRMRDFFRIKDIH